MIGRRGVDPVEGQGLLDLGDLVAAPPRHADDTPSGAPATDGRKRIARQAAALAAGWHPLSLTTAHLLRVHPEAPPPGDRDAPGPRCGTCRFRILQGGHARPYPKCLYPDPDVRPRGGWPRESSGAGSDVRSWWPGCVHYQQAAAP